MTNPPQANRPRAAIYVRVSTAGQDGDGTSLATQEAACRKYAAEHGYAVDEAHVYREVHTGTELWERPRLQPMREAVRRRGVDAVIAYAIDRLARDPVHLGVLISEADHAAVTVAFVTEPLDNSPEGQLIRFVRGYAAKVEHEKIKERSLRGMWARARQGKLMPGWKPLYGYAWNADKSAYVEDPATAAVVRRLFRECLDGRTLRQIAAGLAADAVHTPAGRGPWRTTQVSRLLKTRAYTGHAEAFCTEVIRVGGARRLRERPPGERVALPEGTIPALIDEASFEAVQARLARNQKFASRNNHAPEQTLLRCGFVRCGHCGRRMAAWCRRGEWYYTCSTASNPTPDCPRHSIKAGPLDSAVWRRIETILTDPATIAAELERLACDDPTEADLATVDKALANATRKQENLVRRLGDIDDDGVAATVQAELASLGAQRRRLEQERTTVLQRRAGWQAARERLSDLQTWCRSVASRLGRFDYEQKRLALEALSVQAEVFRSGTEPRFVITARVPLDCPVVSQTTTRT